MKRIISFVLTLILLGALLASCSSTYSSKSKEAAEKYANQQVYYALGLAPEKLTSEIIYENDGHFLVVVKYYLSASYSSDGSICVYCNKGYAVNSTSIMAPDYPFKNNLNELKALFGI